MKDELLDRFGKVPDTAINLLRISLLRTKAHALYIHEIKGGDGKIEIKINPNAKIDSGKIPGLVAGYKGKMTFHASGMPVFVYTYQKDKNPVKAEKALLEDAEALIEKMTEVLSVS